MLKAGRVSVALIMLLVLFSYTACAGDEIIFETVELSQADMLPICTILTDLCPTINVRFNIYNSVTPQIILTGERANVDNALSMIKLCRDNPGFSDLINISCTLEEINAAALKEMGINYADGVMLAADMGFSSDNLNAKDVPQGSWNITMAPVTGSQSSALLTAKLRSGDGKGKVLVSSELSLPNGIYGSLKTTEKIPVFTYTSGGGTSCDYKSVETSIGFLPTIVDFDENKPWDSKIKVDVDMMIGSYVMTSSAAGSYPEVNSRTMKTERIMPADGSSCIAAVLVRDQKTKANSGIPFLRDLPLLKYLFGYEYEQVTRVVAVLKLSARFVPQDFTDMKDYLEKLKTAAEQKTREVDKKNSELVQSPVSSDAAQLTPDDSRPETGTQSDVQRPQLRADEQSGPENDNSDNDNATSQ